MNAKPAKPSKPANSANPANASKSSKMSIHSKRQIFSAVTLFLLLGGYIALFFAPSMPGSLLIRFGLAFLFALLMGTAVFFLIKKRLTAQDFEYIKDEENFARAVRSMKQTKFYTKKFAGFPHGIRKEIIPAAITGLILFLLMCIVSPCRLPEAPMPDFAKMTAQEFYYPYLFAASDSLAVLAPPTLAPETEDWAEKIPAKRYLEWAMYANIFKNHFESANADGNLCENRTSGVSLAMAQSSLLAGKYERAVSEYQAVADAGNAAPDVMFQLAIATAYAGDLRGAEKAMNALNSKAVADAIGDDFALPHWKLVLQILKGDLSEDVLQEYSAMYTRQRNAHAKFNASQNETAASNDAKKPEKSKSDAKSDAKSESEAGSEEAARKALEKRRRLERRVASTANNMAVLQILEGDYANAVTTSNTVLSISRNSAARTGKIMRMCTYNTKGFAVGFLGKSIEDPGVSWDSNVYTTSEEYFKNVRTLYEEILTASRLETEAPDPSYKKSMFYLLPWVNGAQFALWNEFTSARFPDGNAFDREFSELHTLCDGLHKTWCANEVKNVPILSIVVENFLMRESLLIEGLDKDDNFVQLVKVCNTFLNKDASLALLDARTLEMEIQLLGRFAAKEALTISMLDSLLDEQKKSLKMASDFLPETHPLRGRLALCTLRLTLIKNGLSKKDFTTVQTSLNEAQTVFDAKKIPEACWMRGELNAAGRLVNALKKKELSEIQAVFASAIEQSEGNLFERSKVYRDCGFALQHRGYTTDADASNRSARTIFNQQIYRSNTHHFLILQMDKILKH